MGGEFVYNNIFGASIIIILIYSDSDGSSNHSPHIINARIMNYLMIIIIIIVILHYYYVLTIYYNRYYYSITTIEYRTATVPLLHYYTLTPLTPLHYTTTIVLQYSPIISTVPPTFITAFSTNNLFVANQKSQSMDTPNATRRHSCKELKQVQSASRNKPALKTVGIDFSL